MRSFSLLIDISYSIFTSPMMKVLVKHTNTTHVTSANSTTFYVHRSLLKFKTRFLTEIGLPDVRVELTPEENLVLENVKDDTFARYLGWLYRGNYDQCADLSHIELYSFACKYAIEDMKPVIELNLRQRLRDNPISAAEFIMLIVDLERTTLKHGQGVEALRGTVLEGACENGTALMKEERFTEVISKGGTLVIDLVKELMARAESKNQSFFDQELDGAGSSSAPSAGTG